MTEADPDYTEIGCTFDAVIANLIPFYLTAAKGDENVAARTILALIKVHNPATPAEIELAGRIIGFTAAAADNLRLSMRPGLSDSKILRYRTSATALDRSAEKCRTALHQMQALRRESVSRPANPANPVRPQPSGKPQIFNDMTSQLAAMRAAMRPDNPATTAPGRGGS